MSSFKTLIGCAVILQLFSSLTGVFAIAANFEIELSKGISCANSVYWLKVTNIESTPYILEVAQNNSEEIQKIPVYSFLSTDGVTKTFLFSRDGQSGFSITVAEKNQKIEIRAVSKYSGTEFTTQICDE